jgi:predicted small lipoprotein YifL
MSPTFRRLSLILPLVLLAACAARGPVIDTAKETPKQAQERRAQASRPAYNLAGYPPAVREGYIDGCESAKGTSYARKDAARFAADAQYQMGWNDGYGICGKK